MNDRRPEMWEVLQQPDRRWRWCWLPSEDGREPLVSAEAYENAEAAEESARSAFPELEGVVRPGRAEPVAVKAKGGALRLVSGLALLALVAARARWLGSRAGH